MSEFSLMTTVDDDAVAVAVAVAVAATASVVDDIGQQSVGNLEDDH